MTADIIDFAAARKALKNRDRVPLRRPAQIQPTSADRSNKNDGNLQEDGSVSQPLKLVPILQVVDPRYEQMPHEEVARVFLEVYGIEFEGNWDDVTIVAGQS